MFVAQLFQTDYPYQRPWRQECRGHRRSVHLVIDVHGRPRSAVREVNASTGMERRVTVGLEVS